MENKFKHMDYIQNVISRMASNSFCMKGWDITLIAAIMAVSIKEIDWRVCVCCILLNVAFWVLDAYYLRQEKLFRKLYSKVTKETDDKKIDFSMDTSSFQKEVKNVFLLALWNISTTPLYASITAVLMAIIYIKKY